MNSFTKRLNARINICKNNKTKLNHEVKDQFVYVKLHNTQGTYTKKS